MLKNRLYNVLGIKAGDPGICLALGFEEQSRMNLLPLLDKG